MHWSMGGPCYVSQRRRVIPWAGAVAAVAHHKDEALSMILAPHACKGCFTIFTNGVFNREEIFRFAFYPTTIRTRCATCERKRGRSVYARRK